MIRKTCWIGILLSSLILAFGQASNDRPSSPYAPQPTIEPWAQHSKISNEILPEIPAGAGEKSTQKDVFISVVVDENGKVKETDVIRSAAAQCLTCFSPLEQA